MIMKMKLYLSLALMLCINLAYAGTKYHIKFRSLLKDPIELKPGGSEFWALGGLSEPKTIPPNGILELQTESEGSKPGLVGINAYVVSSSQPDGMLGRIEIWEKDHEKSKDISYYISTVTTSSFFSSRYHYIGSNSKAIINTAFVKKNEVYVDLFFVPREAFYNK